MKFGTVIAHNMVKVVVVMRTGFRLTLLIALIVAASCSQSGKNAGDSPLVPLPAPPITRAYPIEIDFTGLPNGAVNTPTQIEGVEVAGADAIVNDGIVLLNPGQLFMAPPEPVTEVAVMVNAQSQSAIIVGVDSQGSQVAQSFTWNLGDYYYYTIRSDAPIIDSVMVTGPDSSIEKAIFARPFDFVSFGSGETMNIGGSASDVIVYDVDSDGKTDIIVGAPASNEVIVGYGDGLGGLALTQTLSTTAAPGDLQLADLDGDTLAELLVALPSANSVVEFDNSNGSFVAGDVYPIGASATALDSGDVNGDGANDVIVGDSAGACLMQNGNLGDGNLLPCLDVGVGSAVADAKIADMNDDGKLDLVVATTGTNSIEIRLGDGSGSFGAPIQTIALGTQVAKTLIVKTLDWDRFPDIAVALTGSPNFRSWQNKKDGTMNGVPLQSFNAVLGTLSDMLAADINADGFSDILFADSVSGKISVYVTLLMGQIQPVTEIASGPAQTILGAGDMNGDFKNDVIAADQFGVLRIFTNVSR